MGCFSFERDPRGCLVSDIVLMVDQGDGSETMGLIQGASAGGIYP